MKWTTLLFLCAFIPCYAQNQPEVSRGQLLYERKCTRCHGNEGDKGVLGAKNLQRSTLSASACFELIANGKGKMPAWKNRLTETQIKDVIQFIQHLRN